MTQSRIGSFIEAITNVAIGYGIALLSQMLVFPLYGINVPLSTNIWIGAWFTVISIARSYALRRWFNARLHAAIGRNIERMRGVEDERLRRISGTQSDQ